MESKCFFLIVFDTGSEILHNPYTSNFQNLLHILLSSQSNSVPYLIVPNYNVLCKFRDDFPGVNCILLDGDKDLEIDKEVFKSLPEIDCIIDFTGKLDSRILTWVPELEFKEKVSWKSKEVNVHKLNDFMNGSEEVLPVLITILPKKEEKNPVKAVAKCVKNKGIAAIKETFKPDKQDESVRFHPSRKFRSNLDSDPPTPGRSISSALNRAENAISRLERTRTGRSDRANTGERQPLLRDHLPDAPGSETDSNFVAAFSDFISWTWSNLCCCFSSCSPELSALPEFRDNAHLESYVRAQHHKYLRSKLTWEDADGIWLRILKSIQVEEEEEVEAERAKYRKKEHEIMNKYHEVVAQNKANPPSMDILIKSAARREQTELDKLKRAERDLETELGRLKIKYENVKDNEGEERFYGELMSAQLRILRHAKDKYKQFADELYEQHFSNWA